MMDLLYANVKDAPPHDPLPGWSDHNLVHLLPDYPPRVRRALWN